MIVLYTVAEEEGDAVDKMPKGEVLRNGVSRQVGVKNDGSWPSHDTVWFNFTAYPDNGEVHIVGYDNGRVQRVILDSSSFEALRDLYSNVTDPSRGLMQVIDDTFDASSGIV